MQDDRKKNNRPHRGMPKAVVQVVLHVVGQDGSTLGRAVPILFGSLPHMVPSQAKHRRPEHQHRHCTRFHGWGGRGRDDKVHRGHAPYAGKDAIDYLERTRHFRGDGESLALA